MAILLFSQCAKAQLLFQKTYGPTSRHATLSRMIPLKNGGYLLVGSLNSDGYLVRTNAAGDTLRTRRYKPLGFDYVSINDVAEDGDGNLLVVGSGGNNLNLQDFNGFILKLNANGDTIWTKRTVTPKFDNFNACIIGNDGNYVVIGNKNRVNEIQKIGKNGVPVWIKTMQYTSMDTGVIATIHPAPNGYFVFISSFKTVPTSSKVFRIDEAGNPVYSFTNYAFLPTDIIVESNNNLLAAANSRFFKFNPQGDTIWGRIYKKGSQYLGIRAVKTTTDGNYILGFDRRNGMDNDIGLMKTTVNGDLIKDTVLFRYGNDEFIKDLVVDTNGDYVFAGYATINSFNNSQFFLAKHRKWNQTLGLKEEEGFTGLKLYPNPAAENAMLESKKPMNGTLVLTNAQGQMLWQETVSETVKKVLPLQNLPPGIYLLRYAGKDGRQFSRKLLKQ